MNINGNYAGYIKPVAFKGCVSSKKKTVLTLKSSDNKLP